MKTDAHIEFMVTQIIARDIAAGVELARSLGYSMPVEFDIGVRFIEDTHERTRIRMRLDDAVYDVIVHLPHLDGTLPLRQVDAMWKTAWDRIHADALTVAQVWIDKHPEARLTKAGAIMAFGILDALADDDALHDLWMRSCAEHAKHFKYSVVS